MENLPVHGEHRIHIESVSIAQGMGGSSGRSARFVEALAQHAYGNHAGAGKRRSKELILTFKGHQLVQRKAMKRLDDDFENPAAGANGTLKCQLYMYFK